MLKVAPDTNIYASAFTSPTGPTFRIWQAVLERRFHLLISPALVAELAKVLRETFGLPEPETRRIVRLVAGQAQVIRPRTVLTVITADLDDNRVLECAVDGKADLIVSNDRHLLDLKEYAGIAIVAGPDFRRTLGV